MSAASSVQFEGIQADPELQKVLAIASHVGVAGNGEVNVSYTSLLIALLWSDDPTSKWIQSQLDELGVRKTAIYAARKIDESQREPILKKVLSGEIARLRTDQTSISARTVLSEARSLANEVGLAGTDLLGSRHVAGVYFFRNPPGHNTQFHVEWGFDKETWRHAFSEFIATTYAQEAPNWSQVLTGYIATGEPESQQLSGTVLGGFVFDAEALGVLRALESAMPRKTPSLFNSEGCWKRY